MTMVWFNDFSHYPSPAPSEKVKYFPALASKEKQMMCEVFWVGQLPGK